jgi:hypothetical protein
VVRRFRRRDAGNFKRNKVGFVFVGGKQMGLPTVGDDNPSVYGFAHGRVL